jgi:hypothetical protein
MNWRDEVVLRDEGCCVAAKWDNPKCYDTWGKPIHPCDTPYLEADYVRWGAVGGRHQFAQDHVLLCPGHHRGTGPNNGYVWATANRALLRDYLEGKHG